MVFRKSFYQNERKRIVEVIKEPLLEYVLMYLPHLQWTKEAREDVWEVVAININKGGFKFKEKDDQIHTRESESIPTLNGPYVKEIFEELFASFQSKISLVDVALTHPSSIKERTDRILMELNNLVNFDIDTMSKLSRELYEEQQRLVFLKRISEVGLSLTQDTSLQDNAVDDKINNQSDEVSSTKQMLESAKAHEITSKIRGLEIELEKRDGKYEKVVEENKRLLELNHMLLSKRKETARPSSE